MLPIQPHNTVQYNRISQLRSSNLRQTLRSNHSTTTPQARQRPTRHATSTPRAIPNHVTSNPRHFKHHSATDPPHSPSHAPHPPRTNGRAHATRHAAQCCFPDANRVVLLLPFSQEQFEGSMSVCRVTQRFFQIAYWAQTDDQPLSTRSRLVSAGRCQRPLPTYTVIATLCMASAGLRALYGFSPQRHQCPEWVREISEVPETLSSSDLVPPCPCSHTIPLSHPARMKMSPAWCLRSRPPCRGVSHGSSRRPLQQISALLPTMRTRVAACQPGLSLAGSCQCNSLGSLAFHDGPTQITGLRDTHFPKAIFNAPPLAGPASLRLHDGCFGCFGFAFLFLGTEPKPVSRSVVMFC